MRVHATAAARLGRPAEGAGADIDGHSAAPAAVGGPAIGATGCAAVGGNGAATRHRACLDPDAPAGPASRLPAVRAARQSLAIQREHSAHLRMDAAAAHASPELLAVVAPAAATVVGRACDGAVRPGAVAAARSAMGPAHACVGRARAGSRMVQVAGRAHINAAPRLNGNVAADTQEESAGSGPDDAIAAHQQAAVVGEPRCAVDGQRAVGDDDVLTGELMRLDTVVREELDRLRPSRTEAEQDGQRRHRTPARASPNVHVNHHWLSLELQDTG